MSFRIDITWLEGAGVADPAEAATWAEIGIQVGTVPVSELLDKRLGVRRTTFFASALPLAEWIADCWPRLINERRGPSIGESSVRQLFCVPADREWLGHHSFRAARQGGAMPFLIARRQTRGVFELRSYPDDGPLAPGLTVRFLRHAEEFVDENAFIGEIHRVVEAALARVGALNTARVRSLRERWAAVQTPLAGLTGRLGLDDDAISDGDRELILGLVEGEDLEVLLSLAEGGLGASVADNVDFSRKTIAHLPAAETASVRWHELEALTKASSHERPWMTGWKAAATLREAVGAPNTEAPGHALPGWLEERCGWSRKGQAFPLPDANAGIDTVYYHASDRMPAVMTSVTLGSARRFRLAGALYHFLFVRSAAPVAPRSQLLPEFSEANAFAAELLAPVARLRDYAPSGGYWAAASIRAAARDLAVSPLVIRHQIENRRLGHLAAASTSP